MRRRLEVLPAALGLVSYSWTMAYNNNLDTLISEYCGISCQNDGICLPGEASFVGHPRRHGAPLPIFSSTHVHGFYCLCRGNWTGVDCSIPYETCDNSVRGEMIRCYHGGKCDGGAVCQCDTAIVNGTTHYAGPYCESPIPDKAFCDNARTNYCLHGGKCQQGNVCQCPAEYGGTHCEVSMATECYLPCRNGGTCKLGEKSGTSFANSQAGSDWEADLFDVTTVEGQYCECPEGFEGAMCQHEVTVCGRGEAFCLHGRVCVEESSEGAAAPRYRCDCPPSSQSTCQITLCDPAPYLEYYAGMAPPAFCVNGGVCANEVYEGNAYAVCNCPELFFGPHCEYIKNGLDLGEANPPPISYTKELRRLGFMSLYIFLGILGLVGLFFVGRSIYRRRRAIQRSKQQLNSDWSTTNLYSFRDEPRAGPRSSNAIYDGELLHEVSLT